MNRHGLRRGLALLLGVLSAAPVFANDTVYYYYTDTLHSAVVETDAQGNVLERTNYGPYGLVLDRSMRDGPGYGGHEEDPATGLNYMQQRYYDPQAGRFVSSDPALPTEEGGNFNRYWFANDNPYRYTDPDGLCPKNSSASTCLESQVKPTTNRTVMPSPAVDKTALAARQQFAVHYGESETLGTIGPDAKGNMTATSITDATTSQNGNGYRAKGKAPANAVAVIHGHLKGTGLVDQTSGGGDAKTLTRTPPLPNYTVSADGNRVGVHELSNGRVEFRMVRGKMTPTEQRKIQKNLDTQQQLFNPSNGSGQ